MSNKYSIAVIIIGLAISGMIIFSTPEPQAVSLEEAKKIAEEFVNEKLLQGQVAANFSGISEKDGLYKISLSVQGTEFTSYMTKDGKLFFPEAFDIENFEAPTAAPAPSGGGTDMVGGC